MHILVLSIMYKFTRCNSGTQVNYHKHPSLVQLQIKSTHKRHRHLFRDVTAYRVDLRHEVVAERDVVRAVGEQGQERNHSLFLHSAQATQGAGVEPAEQLKF